MTFTPQPVGPHPAQRRPRYRPPPETIERRRKERALITRPIPDGRLDVARSVASGFHVEPAERLARLAECRVRQSWPQVIDIWQPLPTKAPGPHLTRPYCCYVNTVIFYAGPVYYVRKGGHPYKTSRGYRWSASSGFQVWDEVHDIFSWEDMVFFDGLYWEVSGGSVIWKNKRWWMYRQAFKNGRRARRMNGLEE